MATTYVPDIHVAIYDLYSRLSKYNYVAWSQFICTQIIIHIN